MEPSKKAGRFGMALFGRTRLGIRDTEITLLRVDAIKLSKLMPIE